jgi:hypothetical protein
MARMCEGHVCSREPCGAASPLLSPLETTTCSDFLTTPISHGPLPHPIGICGRIRVGDFTRQMPPSNSACVSVSEFTVDTSLYINICDTALRFLICDLCQHRDVHQATTWHGPCCLLWFPSYLSIYLWFIPVDILPLLPKTVPHDTLY